MKIYFPYVSDKPNKKYYIVTTTKKKVYFGATGYEDYTTHKDLKRKEAYIKRHQKNEDWNKSGIDTPGFWSYHYLWWFPTKQQAYQNIKKQFL
jgi:Family of unknown function (DUF5754)